MRWFFLGVLAFFVFGCASKVDMVKDGLNAKASGDFSLAFKRFKAACDGGEPHGCTGLGNLYLKGEGVKKDEKTARELLQKGCDGGAGGGCFLLGRALAKSGDKSGAKVFFDRACKMGVEVGCVGHMMK